MRKHWVIFLLLLLILSLSAHNHYNNRQFQHKVINNSEQLLSRTQDRFTGQQGDAQLKMIKDNTEMIEVIIEAIQ